MASNLEMYREPFLSAHKVFWFLVYLTCLWGTANMILTGYEVWNGEPLVEIIKTS